METKEEKGFIKITPVLVNVDNGEILPYYEKLGLYSDKEIEDYHYERYMDDLGYQTFNYVQTKLLLLEMENSLIEVDPTSEFDMNKLKSLLSKIDIENNLNENNHQQLNHKKIKI